MDDAPQLAVLVLGPVELRFQGRSLPLPVGRPRALLIRLVLANGEALSVDRLVDDLWPDPPATAAAIIHGYVSRLRRLLTEVGDPRDILQTEGDTYRLVLPDAGIDRQRFEAGVAAARQLLDAGETASALGSLDAALNLWRGQALADVADEAFAAAEAARLEELRLQAVELRIDARLVLGDHAPLVGELAVLAEREPYREHVCAQRMLALYRCGRQAEALAVYQAMRQTLSSELGIEPSPELRTLERSILSHDPALAVQRVATATPAAEPPPAPERTTPRARRLRRRLLAGGGLALALLLAATALPDGGDAPARNAVLSSSSLGGFEPATGRLVTTMVVPGSPQQLTAGRVDGRPAVVLVAGAVGADLSVIDPADGRRVGKVVPLGVEAGGAAVARGVVWVSDVASPDVLRVDPAYGTVDRLPLSGSQPGTQGGAVEAGAGSIWLIQEHPGSLVRLDPSTGRVTGRSDVRWVSSLAFGAGSVWTGRDGEVARFDPRTMRRTGSARVTGSVTDIAVGGGYVWARVGGEGTIWQIDARTLRPLRSIAAGAGAGAIIYAAERVWLADGERGVERLDPDSGEIDVLGSRHAANALAVAAIDGGVRVFATTLPPGPVAPPGAPVIAINGDIELDPALNWDADGWLVDDATCAGLYRYRHGMAGVGLGPMPEIATTLPVTSDGGLRVAIRIRSGVHFSPPSGASVTAGSMRATIERALSPDLLGAPSPAAGFLDDVVGATAYADGHATHVAGLTVRGGALLFRLRHPLGDLAARLAMPFFCALPFGTPVTRNGLRSPTPMAGPYYVASATPAAALLRRNPAYHGDRVHHLASLLVVSGVDPERGAAAVATHEADFAENAFIHRLSPLFATDGPLDRTFGALAAAPARTHEQFERAPTAGIDLFELNTSRGIFASARERRAASFAIDRQALAATFGEEAVDGYLPAGVQGGPTGGIFPLRPDLARALALADPRGGRAVLLTRQFGACPPCETAARLVTQELAAISIRVAVHQVGEPAVEAGKPGARYDLVLDNWVYDYPDAADFLNPALDGSNASTAAEDTARLDVGWVDRALERTVAMQGTARALGYRAVAERVERALAPWLVFGRVDYPFVLSGRIGCVTVDTTHRIDLAALCLRKSS